MFALKKMRTRSRVMFEDGPWSELLDPQTNSLWYLNHQTWRTTWEPPDELREALGARAAKIKQVEDKAREMIKVEWDDGPNGSYSTGPYMEEMKATAAATAGIWLTALKSCGRVLIPGRLKMERCRISLDRVLIRFVRAAGGVWQARQRTPARWGLLGRDWLHFNRFKAATRRFWLKGTIRKLCLNGTRRRRRFQGDARGRGHIRLVQSRVAHVEF